MRKNLTKIGVLDTILSGWLLFLVVVYGTPAVMAITNYPPGSLLQPSDVTSSHIRDNTIINADVNESAKISATKVSPRGTQGGVLLTDGTNIATSTGLKFATTTSDLYVFGGRVHATSTNFNGVNYTWPTTDGADNSSLTTNAAGVLTWESGGLNRNIFGDGNYGPLTGAVATNTNPIFTNLSANVTAGATSMSVSSSTYFTADDKVLVWQTTGTTAGVWEILEVSATSTGTITLKSAFQNSFTAIGTQVLRMAEYTSVTLEGAASFTNKEWDGSSGGIVAFFATQGVTLASTTNINLNGYGFRGGAGCSNSCVGFQGEGTSGTSTAQSTSPNGNGGGGGPDSTNGLRTGSGGGGFENGSADASTSRGGVGLVYYTGQKNTTFYKAPLLWLGGGGGGGGAGAGSTGTAGADGGGAMLIISPWVVIDGGLTARGNTGTDSGSGVAGSGSNGGGGTLIFATDSFRVASTTSMVSANTATNSGNDVQMAGGKGQHYDVTPLTTITNF